MSKRVTASSWEIVTRDETGAMVDFECTCPNCGEITGELINIGADESDDLDGGFIVDHECGVCGEDLEVVCD